MIRAVFTKNRMTVSGHAGYAPAGQDVVCAAVSALVYTLMGALDEKNVLAEAVVRPGYATVAGTAEHPAFDVVRCGLGQIAGRYPGCVTIDLGD